MSKGRTIFLSAIAGNILEYYDFTVYTVFAISIGEIFFPSYCDEYTKVILSLSVFAMGFVTRPLGGILFGYIADRYGRRTSLIISMLGMTIPTFTMGFIPGYEVIGIYAPIILTVTRLLQGLCISGEGAGAAIFILEHHQNLRPGLTAGIVHSSNIAGTLIATFFGYVIARYFPSAEFAWRFAFIIGGFMGLAGFYLRLKVSETPIFEMLSEKKKTLKVPIIEVFRTGKKPMIVTIALGAAASSIVYLVKAYINIYQCNVLGNDKTVALQYVAYASLVMMITMPLSGYLSDRIGRLYMIRATTAMSFIMALPCFALMSCEHLWQQILSITILAILGGSIAGSAYVFIISIFSSAQRFSGVSFSYNLGIAMCGGTSAAISRFLVEKTGLHYSPAFYIMSTTAAFLIISQYLKSDIEKFLANSNVK